MTARVLYAIAGHPPNPWMARRIDLGSGYIAIVDASDFEAVSQSRWFWQKKPKTVYAIRHIPDGERGQSARRMHRFITAAAFGIQVDHINGDGLDNRRINLRLCTPTENLRNQHSAFGAVPFKGVHKRVRGRSVRYYATITIAGRGIALGCYAMPEDAARAYDSAALEYFGEFAFTNHAMGLL